MATIHINNCPVCGSEELAPLLSGKDNLVSGEIFTVFSCAKCGFAFTQDFPAEGEIGKYYDAPEYVSHSDTQKGIINTLYHLARKSALNSKAALLKKVSGKQTGSALDIGAGTGYFLNRIKEDGWNITGIEKSASAREYAKEKFGLDLYDSDALFQLPEKTQDIVTLWHVLEHLEKLNETMQRIHQLLKDDGTAIIALPNKSSLDARHYKGLWAAYDVPRHLWHFSPSDFQGLAEKNGFCVVAQKPMYFDVFYISMLSEKNRKMPLASFAGLLKGGIFFLRSLSDVKKCSSIIYVLKKK
ncbi:class I SAM-dependent methyltransferase [Viscerimonas tarda]